ncbi:hypothetical protein HDU83_007372 [Entophlyctis luteolus]|nr:hypothetical protein HDU83_007372 [Entophlyctis luteolus]
MFMHNSNCEADSSNCVTGANIGVDGPRPILATGSSIRDVSRGSQQPGATVNRQGVPSAHPRPSSSSSRLAGIAIAVMTVLTGRLPTLELRRVVAVFIACSTRQGASPARQHALPTTVVSALLLVHRFVSKVSAISAPAAPISTVTLPVQTSAPLALPIFGQISSKFAPQSAVNYSRNQEIPVSNLTNSDIPSKVLDMLANPVDLFLATLMLVESNISDSQTSTASWARLYDPLCAATSDVRKKLAALKWTAFEWLNFDIDISKDEFLRWCGVMKRWIGEYPSPLNQPPTSVSPLAFSSSHMANLAPVQMCATVPSVDSVSASVPASPTSPGFISLNKSQSVIIPSLANSFTPSMGYLSATFSPSASASALSLSSTVYNAPPELTFSLKPPALHTLSATYQLPSIRTTKLLTASIGPFRNSQSCALSGIESGDSAAGIARWHPYKKNPAKLEDDARRRHQRV